MKHLFLVVQIWLSGANFVVFIHDIMLNHMFNPLAFVTSILCFLVGLSDLRGLNDPNAK